MPPGAGAAYAREPSRSCVKMLVDVDGLVQPGPEEVYKNACRPKYLAEREPRAARVRLRAMRAAV